MNFYAKTVLVLSFLLSTPIIATAQFPTTCFEIESILVDACGSPEGENEMVRFITGSSPLNVSNMTVNWPNNSWQGICQNATTNSAVNALNTSIQSCGLLIEPTGGIIPANSNVLLVTSSDIDVNANSFANLSDTMYIIFQCAGNTSGHFANWNTSPGMRTLIISFSSPVGCSDTVTYDRTILVNQNGTIGGSSAIRNGALANFDWTGNTSYDNFGCQAPFIPPTINVNAISSVNLCANDSIDVFTSYTSSIQNISWSANNGSFSSLTNDTTTYYLSPVDTGSFHIIVSGISLCGDTVRDSVLINVITPAVSTQNISICQGQTFTLPGGAIVNNTGTYNDTLFNGSFLGCDSIIITNLNVSPSSSFTQNPTICQGQMFTLPGGSIVSNTGIYIDTLFNSSSSGCDSIVTTNLTVSTSISSSQNPTICQGQTFTLPGGAIASSSGTYIDTLFNGSASGCDSIITTNLTVTINSASIIESNTTICEGDVITLHAITTGNISWSTGEINVDSILVSTSGTISVTSNNNGCIAQDFIVITVDNCIDPEIIIPNVISPNGDLSNDVFKVQGNNISNVKAKIFNRWGQVIYEWDAPNAGWDGRTNAGKLVPEGTYFYVLEVLWEDNSTQEFTGNINVFY